MTLVVTPQDIVEKAEASGRPGLLARAEDWQRIPLGDVATIVNGAPFSSRLFNNTGVGLPLVRIRDVARGATDTFYDGPYDNVHLVKAGDLLVGMDGDFRVAVWRSGTALLNQRVCRIEVSKPEIYHPVFLRYVLQGYLDAIWTETSAVTVKHLSSKTLAQIPLPLPPFDEQCRIVASLEDHLSRLEVGTAGIVRARHMAPVLRQAVLKAAFSGSLISSDGEWNEATLSDVADWSSGGTPASSNARYYGGEIPWVVIGDLTESWVEVTEKCITAEGFENSATRLLPRETVMLAMYGASIGRTGKMSSQMTTNQAIACAVVRKELVEPDFLLYYLQSQKKDFIAAGQGGAQPNISQRIVKAWPFRFPSLEEQRRIVSVLDDTLERLRRMDEEVQEMERRASVLRRVLLQSAFSGQLTKESSSV